MTGYSVSEVAHGEQVSIQDRPGKVELSAWGSAAYGMRHMTQGGQEKEIDLKILCCYYRMGRTGGGKWNEREP